MDTELDLPPKVPVDVIECKGYHVVMCLNCAPLLPVPFDQRDLRDNWAIGHTNATGHITIRVSP